MGDGFRLCNQPRTRQQQHRSGGQEAGKRGSQGRDEHESPVLGANRRNAKAKEVVCRSRILLGKAEAFAVGAVMPPLELA
jgi:hypothetical protein